MLREIIKAWNVQYEQHNTIARLGIYWLSWCEIHKGSFLFHDYGTIVRMGETCGVANGPLFVFRRVSFLHASEPVFFIQFIQFTICLLTVQTKLTPHNGILRETLITLLGIFGSRSSSVRLHVCSSSLPAKNFAISSIYGGATLPFHVLLCMVFCFRYISVFSTLFWVRSLSILTSNCPFYSTFSLFCFGSVTVLSILLLVLPWESRLSTILVGSAWINHAIPPSLLHKASVRGR